MLETDFSFFLLGRDETNSFGNERYWGTKMSAPLWVQQWMPLKVARAKEEKCVKGFVFFFFTQRLQDKLLPRSRRKGYTMQQQGPVALTRLVLVIRC